MARNAFPQLHLEAQKKRESKLPSSLSIGNGREQNFFVKLCPQAQIFLKNKIIIIKGSRSSPFYW
jgi:hypothetical protein